MSNTAGLKTLRGINVYSQYVYSIRTLLSELKGKEVVIQSNNIYPVAYLFRHSLELGIKLLIVISGGKFNFTHNIFELKEIFISFLKIDNNTEISILFSKQQKSTLEFNIKEKFEDSNAELILKFENFNLTPFVKLLDKYFDNDVYNTRFRYGEDDITFVQKTARYEEISKDILILDELIILFNFLILARLDEIKEI